MASRTATGRWRLGVALLLVRVLWIPGTSRAADDLLEQDIASAALAGKWERVEALTVSSERREEPSYRWLGGFAALERSAWSEAFERLSNLPADDAGRQGVVDVASNLLEQSHESATAQMLFADALLRAGRHEEALAHVREAMSRGARSASVHSLEGLLLVLVGRQREAEGALDSALAMDGNRVDALLTRAIARFKRGNLDGARADIAAAQTLAPDLPPLINARGVAAYLRGDAYSALDDFKQAAASKALARAAGNNLRLAAAAVSRTDTVDGAGGDEAMQIRTTIIDGITRMNQTVGFLEAVSGQKLDPNIKIPLSFAPALMKDIEQGRQGRLTSPLVSHTLEQIGVFGLKTLPTVVDNLKSTGKLPPNFNVPPTLFGIDKLVAGGASAIGSGRVGLTETTQLLDGVSNMTAAVAGMLVGGPRGAKIGETGAELFRPIARGLTMPYFQDLANHPVRMQFIANWQSLAESALARGLPVPTFSGLYKEQLRQVGFMPDQIRQLDGAALWLNRSSEQKRYDLPIPSPMTDPGLFKGKLYMGGPPPPPPPPPVGREAGVRLRGKLETEKQWQQGTPALLLATVTAPGAVISLDVPRSRAATPEVRRATSEPSRE